MAAPIRKIETVNDQTRGSLTYISIGDDTMCNDKKHGDEADVWLFDSIKAYQQLYMYELQNPATALEWSSSTNLCVSVQHSRKKSEILELALPDKLLASADDQGIEKNRDFHVRSGGFHDGPVCDLKYLGSRMIAVAGEGDTALHIYMLGSEKSDIVKKVQSIPQVVSCTLSLQEAYRSCLAVCSDGTKVLLGNRISSLGLVDISRTTVTASIDETGHTEPLSGLHFLDEHRFVACCCCGTGWLHDSREKLSVRSQIINLNGQVFHKGMKWTSASTTDHYNCLNRTYGDSSKLFFASDRGNLVVYDSRMFQEPMCQDQLEMECIPAMSGILSLQVSSADDSSLSIHTYGDHVYIFTSPTWSTGSSLKPSFSHKGHKVCSEEESVRMTGHIWHPQITDLVISTADDGSLHAWQPDKQHTSFGTE